MCCSYLSNIQFFIFISNTSPEFLTPNINVFTWMSNIRLEVSTLTCLRLSFWFLLSLSLSSLTVFIILIWILRAKTLERAVSLTFYIQSISTLCHLPSKYIHSWFTPHHFYHNPCHQAITASCFDYSTNS